LNNNYNYTKFKLLHLSLNLEKEYAYMKPNSNRTVPKSNILIFKAAPDHDHDRSIDHLIKTVTKFYIKIKDFSNFSIK
jgi:hypothetical protein